MVDATLEEREGHVTVVLEDVGKPLLETAAVLHEVGNVTPGERIVEHLQDLDFRFREFFSSRFHNCARF